MSRNSLLDAVAKSKNKWLWVRVTVAVTLIPGHPFALQKPFIELKTIFWQDDLFLLDLGASLCCQDF